MLSRPHRSPNASISSRSRCGRRQKGRAVSPLDTLLGWPWWQRRPFPDRAAAGQALATRLRAYAGHPGLVVLALPRGGLPVAFAVARALGAPLDLLLVRKLGTPGQTELAMGAIAEGDVQVLNDEVVQALAIGPEELAQAAVAEGRELERQARSYRRGQKPPDLRGQVVILVDDGLATGTTMRAAIAAVRAQQPEQLIVAVPVAARETAEELQALVDALIAVEIPEDLVAIGLWYQDFSQTSDDEVCDLLRQAAEARERDT